MQKPIKKRVQKKEEEKSERLAMVVPLLPLTLSISVFARWHVAHGRWQNASGSSLPALELNLT